ncbi:MAG: Gfo/Idh/MocA family oxidoreductase [Saccharofermentanales bacterium]
MKDTVRFGIIGLGNMGSAHFRSFLERKIPRGEVKAVCDIKENRLDWAKEKMGDNVACFSDAGELISSGLVDAVLIATPHYFHPVYAVEALKAGLHVLVEKPAGVYTKQVMVMNAEAQKRPELVFGIMLNQRTNPVYKKAHDLVKAGELGEIKRVNWIITGWYRTQAYYDSGEWRATWAGEGGGVLMNQSPHQLDLLQWICGMPRRVRAFCYEGKFHDIEVEDDVTTFLEYENGASGVFVTSTGDTPGTNRLEILGDRGKIIVDDGRLEFWSLKESEREFCRRSTDGFAVPETWKCDVPVVGDDLQHVGIFNDFVNAVLDGTDLIADGREGIRSVELANAMYMSSWTGDFVSIPVDSEKYYDMLQDKIKNSSYKKNVNEQVADLEGTF